MSRASKIVEVRIVQAVIGVWNDGLLKEVNDYPGVNAFITLKFDDIGH